MLSSVQAPGTVGEHDDSYCVVSDHVNQQTMSIDMVHALATAAPELVSLGIRVSNTVTRMALVAFAHLEELYLTSGNADLIELDLRILPCLTEARISPLP